MIENKTNDKKTQINDRLAYIDFKLRFTGHVSRQDLSDTFGIAEASASRALSEYDEATKHQNKTHRANTILRSSFEPLFDMQGEVALGTIAHGFNKNKFTDRKAMLPYLKIGVIQDQLNTQDVAKITRAISGQYAIQCNYFSLNSNKHGLRTLLPLAVMYDGTQWMFRAYDRSAKDGPFFKNFHFSRTANVHECYEDKESKQLNHESLSNDKAWNTIVPVELKLHRSLNENDMRTVRQDFGMTQDQEDLLTKERVAFLWIIYRKFKVDEKPDNSTYESGQFNFELANAAMIDMLRDW